MMRRTASTPRPARWPWLLLIVGVALLNVIAWGYQSGICVDYTAESGQESHCSSGPAIGVPAAVVLLVVSVIVMTYALHRLLRGRPSNGAGRGETEQ